MLYNLIYCIQLMTILKTILMVQLLAALFSSTPISTAFSTNPSTPPSFYRITIVKAVSTSNPSAVSVFTVSYPTSFAKAPYSFAILNQMKSNSAILIKVQILTIGLTSLTSQLTYSNQMSLMVFSYIVFDSVLYTYTSSYFTYVLPATYADGTVFNINVTHNQKHSASFIQELSISLGPYPSGFALDAVSTNNLSLTQIGLTKLSFTFDSDQILVKKLNLLFVDFVVQNFTVPANLKTGMHYVMYGTNGVLTDLTQTGNYQAMYGNSYLAGLQMIYSLQLLAPPISIDIDLSISLNSLYYISQLLLLTYKCPAAYPITNINRSLCYDSCDIGYYVNSYMQCALCDPNCRTCVQNATFCQTCTLPYLLQYGYICSCPNSTIQINYSNGTFICSPCHQYVPYCYSCKKIASQFVCTACMSNLELISESCSCPLDTELLLVQSNAYCIQNSSLIIEECYNNFTANGNVCFCDRKQNQTIINGTCTLM